MKVLIWKGNSEDECLDIEDTMLSEYAYDVDAVDMLDGTFVIIGTKEEKECFDDYIG